MLPALLASTVATAGETDPMAGERFPLTEVVVTAPATERPLTVVTDPKAPRQPVPPADGAGYLKSIPGFSVVRKGGNGGDPMFRGLGASRLNVLVDDAPVLGGCGGRMDPPTTYVFPESYDRITVLKGPQTVTRGPGNIAGTVLFERDTPHFEDLGYRGMASAVFGSRGRNDQLIDITGGAREGYVRAIGTRAEADDYRDGNDQKVRSFYDRKSATGILGWTPNRDTTVEISADYSEAEAAYADRGMDGVAFDRQGFKLHVEKKSVTPVIDRLQAEAYYSYIDHVMDNFSLRPLRGMAMLSNPDRTTQGGRALADLLLPTGSVLTVGFDYNRDEHTARQLNNAEFMAGLSYEDKPRLPDMTFDNLGVFAELEHALSGNGRVVGGLRLDRVDVEDERAGRQASDDDQLVSGFLRYERAIDPGFPMTGYVGLGHVERAPDWWERNRVFRVDPESNNQIDIGFVHHGARLRGSLSSFYSRIDDFILVSTAAPLASNVDATMFGGEAEVGYALTSQWSVSGSLAYVRGENRATGGPLPQIPPLEATANLGYDDGMFFGGLLMRAVARQERVDIGKGTVVGTDIGPTAGFAVWSLNGGWRPRANLLLAVGVDNLFDKNYAEHVSKGTSATVAALGYPQTTRINESGRTLWAKGTVRF